MSEKTPIAEICLRDCTSHGCFGAKEVLEDLIHEDQLILDEFGLSHEQVAERIEWIIDRDKVLLERERKRTLSGKKQKSQQREFAVSSFSRATISNPHAEHCPFHGCDYATSGRSTHIRNLRNGESVSIRTLTIHLIRKHHVYGSRFYHHDMRKLIKVIFDK